VFYLLICVSQSAITLDLEPEKRLALDQIGVYRIEYADVIRYTIMRSNATDSNSTPWSARYRC
jgi:hypothetical protein